jgi:hypothetical protein
MRRPTWYAALDGARRRSTALDGARRRSTALDGARRRSTALDGADGVCAARGRSSTGRVAAVRVDLRSRAVISGSSLAIAIAILLIAIGAASPASAKKPHVRARCSAAIFEGFVVEEHLPRELSGEPDPAAVSRFEVLRRPATAADQPPPINELGSQLGFELGSYYPHAIKQVMESPDGDRYYVVLGFRRRFSVPPARCLPPALRRKRAKLVREVQRQAKELVYCVAELRAGGAEPAGYSDAECGPLADVENGSDLIASDTSRSRVVELVPDGVASVRLIYRDGTAIDAAVHTNAFAFTPPQAPIRRAEATIRRAFHRISSLLFGKKRLTSLQKRRRRRLLRSLAKVYSRALGALVPKQAQWLDQAGRVLRTITPHLPASGGGLFIVGG